MAPNGSMTLANSTPYIKGYLPFMITSFLPTTVTYHLRYFNYTLRSVSLLFRCLIYLKIPLLEKNMSRDTSFNPFQTTTFTPDNLPTQSNQQIAQVTQYYQSNQARFRNQSLDKKGCPLCGGPRAAAQVTRNDRLCTTTFKNDYFLWYLAFRFRFLTTHSLGKWTD